MTTEKTPEAIAYAAGWAASKRTRTYDLDAAEGRFEARYGRDFGGSMFAAGWVDYAADHDYGTSLREPVELLVCHDCACVMANCEYVEMTADGYADRTPALVEAWQAHGWQPRRLVLACEPDEVSCPDYSTHPCDTCGSGLAGWRHRAAHLELSADA